MQLTVALIVVFISTSSHALTVDQLLTENKLTIKTTIKQGEQQIVGQPIIIVIEVATDRWFAKGTKILNIELADIIILANSETSINGTIKVNGQTWSTQTREIVIYPRRHGDYKLPSIGVQVSINTLDDGIVEGIIETTEQYFTILLPDELTNIENFIVSPQVILEVKTEGDDNSENRYVVGSAITKTMTITTQSAPAMMIPPLQQTEVKGLSIYHKTPQVFDKSNRGELIGTRTETFTYIFEQVGQYQIPEQIIFWWDTNNNRLQEIIIPSLLFKVGKSKTSINLETSSVEVNLQRIIWLITVSSAIFVVAILLFRFKSKLLNSYNKITQLEKRMMRKSFIQAISNHNYISALDYLYKYSLLIDVDIKQVKSANLSTLNNLAFGDSNLTTTFSLQNAKALLKELSGNKTIIGNKLDVNKAIKLNNQP
jgi:hypothetical protein